jgi:hypothetical protein
MKTLAGAALVALSLLPAPAAALCYEEIGCTNTDRYSAADLFRLAECDILFQMRNGIYKEHGLCFRTERAIAALGNQGCSVQDAGALRLNPVEQANIATITAVERQKNCPR